MWHAQPVKYRLHRRPRARRVGDEDHRAALGAKTDQRVAGLWKSRDAIVHHAPKVAEQHVVIARERGEAFDNVRQGLCDDRDGGSAWPRTASAATGTDELGEAAAHWRSNIRRWRGSALAAGSLQRLGAHRPRWREQKALAETHVVIQKIDHG